MPACAVEDGRSLTGDFGTDFEMLRELFRLDGTFRFREVRAGAGMRCALLYLDGMVNNELIYNAVIRPLLLSEPAKGDPAQWLLETALYAGDVKVGAKVRDLLRALLYGDSVLLVEGAATALLINTKGFRTRGISEPENEAVQKGPREGFDEVAMLNLSQLRRRLQTPDLAVEVLRVGRRTDTMVFVCYLASLARPRLVREVRRRLEEISIDGILDANYIAELTRDHAFSLFETTGSSERPDVIASKLLEGRVALIVDGTPVVLTVPYLFCENFQSDEDYYQSFWVSSVGRLLRYVSFFLTVSVPALYLALLTHHTRLLPTFLLLSAAQSRAGVPFSSLTECLALIVILELLGETGARMPQQLGHTLSIVGGLVVGQAAVEARLVSAPMLIVVALSGIAGLMVPRLRGAVLYARVGMVLLAAVLGLPGCFLGLTVIAVRLMGLSSYGVPYLSPLEHPDLQGLKDTAWRLPWRFMRTRPAFSRNSVRQRGGKRRE